MEPALPGGPRPAHPSVPAGQRDQVPGGLPDALLARGGAVGLRQRRRGPDPPHVRQHARLGPPRRPARLHRGPRGAGRGARPAAGAARAPCSMPSRASSIRGRGPRCATWRGLGGRRSGRAAATAASRPPGCCSTTGRRCAGRPAPCTGRARVCGDLERLHGRRRAVGRGGRSRGAAGAVARSSGTGGRAAQRGDRQPAPRRLRAGVRRRACAAWAWTCARARHPGRSGAIRPTSCTASTACSRPGAGHPGS